MLCQARMPAAEMALAQSQPCWLLGMNHPLMEDKQMEQPMQQSTSRLRRILRRLQHSRTAQYQRWHILRLS